MDASASLRSVSVVLEDRVVLRDIDLELGPGLTLLRGPNGAGKTTILKALAGLVPIARGSRHADDLLYIAHRPQLLRGLSARANLEFFARFRARADPDTVATALDEWGLGADADRPVERLSAGQRRRAALARVLSEPCGVVLMDEPFAELDDAAAEQLRSVLEVLRDGGRAVLVASHGHRDLDTLATHVVRVADGRLA